MAYWEFLIQREGARSWRSIKTGNLQLKAGRYRIVAKSDLLATRIETRISYQLLGTTSPQRRSSARSQVTNPRGVALIVPFMQLESGIWQFLCSGEHQDRSAWHQILKLRVLPSAPDRGRRKDRSTGTPATPAPPPTDNAAPVPTAPLFPLCSTADRTEWADALDRLLDQIERDSLQPPPVRCEAPAAPPIQLQPLTHPPAQLIELDRSSFRDVIPGMPIVISGACNLQLLDTALTRKVAIDRLAICVRHPETFASIVSIERSLPPQLDLLTFEGRLIIPPEVQISPLLGEVSLYDRHNIQVGASRFTVALALDPLPESDLALLELFELPQLNVPELDLEQLVRDLGVESPAATPERPVAPPATPSLTAIPIRDTFATSAETTVRDARVLDPLAPPQSSVRTTFDIASDDLEFNFELPSFAPDSQLLDLDCLEIVIDD